MNEQPTIYARTMKRACAEPETQLEGFLGDYLGGFKDDLRMKVLGLLRQAYHTGVVDGFQQGVQADDAASLRLRQCLAPLLCIVRNDHGDGSDTEGLPELLAAASNELDVETASTTHRGEG